MVSIGWALGGEIEFAHAVPQCEEEENVLSEDTVHVVTYMQQYNLVYSSVCLGLFCLASCFCGVHHTKYMNDIEMRWQKRSIPLIDRYKLSDVSSSLWVYRVLWFIRACTCRSYAKEEEDVFKSLGMLLSKVFVVRYNNNQEVFFIV